MLPQPKVKAARMVSFGNQNKRKTVRQMNGRNITVAETAKVPQTPGCLPQGYDGNSLLTLDQFAVWKQISMKTVRKRLAITPGLVKHSRKDQRIHVATHLDKVLKRT